MVSEARKIEAERHFIRHVLRSMNKMNEVLPSPEEQVEYKGLAEIFKQIHHLNVVSDEMLRFTGNVENSHDNLNKGTS
jgi:hypothetical protein